jgi:hypothetical protein
LGDGELKQQSAPQMRSFMCGFLADLPGVKSNTAQVAQQEAGTDRGAAPASKKKGREIRPKAELDVFAAKQALEPGDATIRGKACTTNSAHGQQFRDYLSNESVFLYPVTPYLDEVIRLYEKAGPGDTVVISPFIHEMRMAGRTNSEGEFQFVHLKPGKYLVMAESDAAGAGTYVNYDGATETQDTITHHYSEHEFFREWHNILKDRVTISKPGQTVKISLTPPFRAQGVVGRLLNRGQQKGTGIMGLSCSEWQFK